MPLRFFLLSSCPETLCPASAWRTETSYLSYGLRHSVGDGHGLTATGSAHTGAVNHSGDASAARGILSPAQTPPPRGGEAKAESQAWRLSPEHAAGLSSEPRSRDPRKLCALMCPAGRLMRLHILDLPRAGGDGLRGGTGVRQGQGQLCFLQTSFPLEASVWASSPGGPKFSEGPSRLVSYVTSDDAHVGISRLDPTP
ncbi:unnamed protein product [Rangifer tarandus platyrhynchus]|uniref:Uncharacterized protein n=1 Tax=Rangifer tarandus platyrhynchus TaxID=3082113 RepID=A0AC59ZG19_RANTA